MRKKRLHHEVEHLERLRAGCPRTVGMHNRLWDALTSWPRNHRIEVALVGLGYDMDRGRELSPEEEARLENMLRGVEQQAAMGHPA